MSTSSERTIRSAVERQMRNWEIARQQAAPSAEPEAPTVNAFVAVSRALGCGGSAVAQALAERTGWPLFDRELLQHMAGDDDVRKRLYESMDERDLGFIEESLRAFTSTTFTRNDYFHRLTGTILAIARKGQAIFLGRGADLILPRGAGVRVRTTALPAACAQRYAEAHGVDTVVAAREIERIEQERARFLRQYFGVELDAPDRFDLTINLSAISVEEATRVVTALLEARALL